MMTTMMKRAAVLITTETILKKAKIMLSRKKSQRARPLQLKSVTSKFQLHAVTINYIGNLKTNKKI